MIEQITKGIKVSVETNFEGTFYKHYKVQFSFGYKITIENQSANAVQLDSRHWEIYDALNNIEVVKGEGVIGQKPILESGEVHTYKSGCTLISPLGAMKGFYKMINLNDGKSFPVTIPLFKLNAPMALN